MFVRRLAAKRTAGFDEMLGVGSGTPFQSGEETDFILRVLALGGTADYDPELQVHHEQVAAKEELTRSQAYSQGFGRVLRKHRYGAPYLSYRLTRSALRSLLAAAMLDGRVARYKMIWAIGTLRGYLAKG